MAHHKYTNKVGVKTNVQSLILTSIYTTVANQCENNAGTRVVYLPSLHIIPTLFAYFLVCHPTSFYNLNAFIFLYTLQ